MARKVKKLPKWAIKQAGGINKKAWRLARAGKKGSKSSKSSGKSSGGGSHRVGIVGKLNAGLRGLRLGLPAIGSAMTRGINKDSPQDMISRYTGFDLKDNSFNIEAAKKSVAFYAGNVIEAKVMGALRIPQMAGQKKGLAIVANFLPEISAIPDMVAGDFPRAANTIGQLSIGYTATEHRTWLEEPFAREQFLKGLGARIGLGLFSRFAGPMINKRFPKGINPV